MDCNKCRNEKRIRSREGIKRGKEKREEKSGHQSQPSYLAISTIDPRILKTNIEFNISLKYFIPSLLVAWMRLLEYREES